MNNIPSYIQEQGETAIAEFVARFPVFNTDLDAVVESVGENYKPIKKEAVQGAIPDGTITLCNATGKYHGYYGGRVVTKARTAEKARNKLATHFNVVEFFGEE